MPDDNPDYAPYLIEARIKLGRIADLARSRQLWDAATETIALARLLGDLARVLTHAALAGNPPQ